MLTTRIEIAAPPEVVREKFLDFSQIPTYSPNGFIKSITPKTPDKPVETGDVFSVILDDMSFTPVILENSPARFRWLGFVTGLTWLFTGEHIFWFNESQITAGHTTFVQEEVFGGVMKWIVGDGWLASKIGFRAKTERDFGGFNVDLKACVERVET